MWNKFSQVEKMIWFCSDRKELIKPRSRSALQLSTFSRASFYINKSFFPSPSLPLLLVLSYTPTQSLWKAHEDGWRKERGGWSMTRETGTLLSTPHPTALYPYFLRILSTAPPSTICFQVYFSSQINWSFYKFTLKTLLFVLEITHIFVNLSSLLAMRF